MEVKCAYTVKWIWGWTQMHRWRYYLGCYLFRREKQCPQGLRIGYNATRSKEGTVPKGRPFEQGKETR